MDYVARVAWDGVPEMGIARDRAEAARLFAAADEFGTSVEMRMSRPEGAPGFIAARTEPR
jgi:hypothetical protein